MRRRRTCARLGSELARAHPDIRVCVSRIDILRLGHAMVRPVVAFLGSAERRRARTAPAVRRAWIASGEHS